MDGRRGRMLQSAGPGGMRRRGVRWGAMPYNAVGPGGQQQRSSFISPFLGEIQEFDKSPYNPIKSPGQLEADHRPGRLTSSTLK